MDLLLKKVTDHWAMEDGIYRFYHQSQKVYHLQDCTIEMVNMLKMASPPDTKLNEWFMSIISDGTDIKFDMDHNDEWLKHTRPIMEAFFQAKFFIEMSIKYALELEEAPNMLPSGWAALLYLYGLRYER